MKKIRFIYNSISKWSRIFENWFISLAILLISFLYTFTVFNRLVMPKPISGIEETTLFITVAMVFIGAAVCTRDENHINVNILPLFLKNEQAKQWFKVLGDMGAIFFVIVFAYKSLIIAIIAFENKELAASIELPLYIPYLLPVIGMTLVILHYIPLTIRDISVLRALRSKGKCNMENN